MEPPGLQGRRQSVKLPVLAAQILQIRPDRHLLAGSAHHELVRLELAPVAIDVRDQPLMQRVELPARNLVRDFWTRLDGGRIELGAENIADGVALEGAADAAGKPVHVLKAAVAIVTRRDAEVDRDAS